MIVSLNCYTAAAAEKWSKARYVMDQKTVDLNCVAVFIAPFSCGVQFYDR
jgi:hypothetical protein